MFLRPLGRIALACLLVSAAPGAARAQDAGVPSTTGLVVSTSAPASDVGAAVLRRGGNAVDAAVATAFALAVTHPSAGNLGGGGFMVVRTPSGEATTFDYRERAPRAATPTMYLDGKGAIDRSLTAAGYLAPGVPGTVRGLALAHARFGRLAWADVVTPAADLAARGFRVSASLARGLNGLVGFAKHRFPATVAAYGKPGGGEWAEGDTLVLGDLAKTLRAIAADGPDVFYTGWIAERIAADMKAHGGLITRQDLAEYRARERAPVRGTFLGHEIIAMPPPSSGGVVLVEMLNVLEQFDLKAHPRFSPWTLHLLIETMRRAYLDRARYLGDPDFVRMPLTWLTSKSYAKTLARGIDLTKASSSVELGRDLVTPPAGDEPDETTQFSVVDRDGMAVSNTYTLEGGYGSKVVVAGAGFLLNNEMGDFNKKPGETNRRGDIGTAANLIAPGKRMLSSMSPTIVTKDGRLVLVTGSPGGRTIINTVLNVVLNVTAYGMSGRQAVDAPRLHHQWLPDTAVFEDGAIPAPVAAALRAMGHEVVMRGRQGDAESILFDAATGTAYGINDRRSADSKASR